MPVGLMETAVDALVLHLQDVLDTIIGEIEAQYNDGIPLPLPTAYRKSEVIERDAFPLVEVLGQRTRVLSVDGPGQMHTGHEIEIVVTAKNDNSGEQLREQVYRYARGVVEAVKTGRGVIGTHAAVGAKAYTVEWGDPMVDFSPAFRQRNTSTVLADAVVSVRLNRQEVI